MTLNDNSLGKSLANVFARTQRQHAHVAKGYLEVDIHLVQASPDNPRRDFDPQALAELAESIRTHGILQPIVVHKRPDGTFQIVSGERRYRAAREAGLGTVPVVLREELDDRILDELRLIENVQREDLNPIELAEAYASLIERHGLSQEELGARLGKDRSSIANILRLRNLPEAIREAVRAGELGLGHARALLGIEDEAAQLALARRIVEEGLSVRAVEAAVREAAPPAPAAGGTTTTRRSKPSHVRELEENLGRLFGTTVQISERGGRGTLTLRFHSADHFRAITDVLERAFAEGQRI